MVAEPSYQAELGRSQIAEASRAFARSNPELMAGLRESASQWAAGERGISEEELHSRHRKYQ